jgi:maleylacetate reductase
MTGIGPFIFPGLRSRVIFGHGTIVGTAAEIARLGRTRPMVLSTPNHKAEAEAPLQRLGNLCVGAFAGAAMHTPVEVTETALTTFRARGADCVVALGGGSATGLGKAIAVRTGADQVVIPTTYAGSEMTNILGATMGGEKKTRRAPAILPERVIYDVDLTMSLPAPPTSPQEAPTGSRVPSTALRSGRFCRKPGKGSAQQ